MTPAANANLQQVLADHRPAIVRHLKRYVDAHEAEDLAQIVLLKVANALSAFRGASSLSTWIHRITVNVALDHLRRRTTAPQGPVEEEEMPSVEALAVRGEMNSCIREFVDALPEHYRKVVVLAEIEGYSGKEIAARLGLSAGAVKIRLHRGRQELRDRLARGCEMYRDERNEPACSRRPCAPQDR